MRLIRPKSEIHLIERAKNAQFLFIFIGFFGIQKHGLTWDSISRRAKVGKTVLEHYRKNAEIEPDPEHYGKLLRLSKEIDRKAARA